MIMAIEVRGIEDVNRMLASLADLPVALRYAKNALIGVVWEAEKVQAMADMDRPKPFTLSQILYDKKETDGGLGRVWVRDPFRSNIGADESTYHGVNILGGTRDRLKASERALQAAGLMPSGHVWVPADGVRLDAHGNIGGSVIQKMVNDLKSGDRSNFFLLGTPPRTLGVFIKVDDSWHPFLWFNSPRQYSAGFDFYGRADAEIAYHWPRIYEEAMDRALQAAGNA
jgi:hypothetical protein